MQSAYGVGVDWPISYSDLEPWYCQAEKALGVAGDDAEWKEVHGAFRSQAFPMSKIWPSWSDMQIARKLNGVPIAGHQLAVLSTPSARNSQVYDGRPPCAATPVVFQSPDRAKYDASVHVKRAVEKHATLREKSVVTRLEVDADKSVHLVHYKHWMESQGKLGEAS